MVRTQISSIPLNFLASTFEAQHLVPSHSGQKTVACFLADEYFGTDSRLAHELMILFRSQAHLCTLTQLIFWMWDEDGNAWIYKQKVTCSLEIDYSLFRSTVNTSEETVNPPLFHTSEQVNPQNCTLNS